MDDKLYIPVEEDWEAIGTILQAHSPEPHVYSDTSRPIYPHDSQVALPPYRNPQSATNLNLFRNQMYDFECREDLMKANLIQVIKFLRSLDDRLPEVPSDQETLLDPEKAVDEIMSMPLVRLWIRQPELSPSTGVNVGFGYANTTAKKLAELCLNSLSAEYTKPFDSYLSAIEHFEVLFTTLAHTEDANDVLEEFYQIIDQPSGAIHNNLSAFVQRLIETQEQRITQLCLGSKLTSILSTDFEAGATVERNHLLQIIFMSMNPRNFKSLDEFVVNDALTYTDFYQEVVSDKITSLTNTIVENLTHASPHFNDINDAIQQLVRQTSELGELFVELDKRSVNEKLEEIRDTLHTLRREIPAYLGHGKLQEIADVYTDWISRMELNRYSLQLYMYRFNVPPSASDAVAYLDHFTNLWIKRAQYSYSYRVLEVALSSENDAELLTYLSFIKAHGLHSNFYRLNREQKKTFIKLQTMLQNKGHSPDQDTEELDILLAISSLTASDTNDTKLSSIARKIKTKKETLNNPNEIVTEFIRTFQVLAYDNPEIIKTSVDALITIFEDLSTVSNTDPERLAKYLQMLCRYSHETEINDMHTATLERILGDYRDIASLKWYVNLWEEMEENMLYTTIRRIISSLNEDDT